ncbi:MAG: hypothetical protein MJA83_01895, partial [Gammaproteobacteria bacterium]|nr:hypothetical protein [Gammaproteobacteria bacterium]
TIPDLYKVFLSTGGREVFVGNFSYVLDSGRSVDLPNYPPMEIGALAQRGNDLFVGVKDGSEPGGTNRFLMPSGLEIYDIGIPNRPIRLSQLRTEQPVTGVALSGQSAFLAAGSDGLLVVDITDLENPLLISSQPVPGHVATDVDINNVRGILAMSVSNILGTGFVRFFDLQDPQLDAPLGFTTINFTEGDLRGQPIDVQWLGDELYVLLIRDGRLYVAVFDGFGGDLSYTVHEVERGSSDGDLSGASFVVQFGQVAITNGREYLVLQGDTGSGFETVYWQSIDSNATELFVLGGQLFLTDGQGMTRTPIPDFAVASITPATGARITRDTTLRVQVNDLFNTNEPVLRSAISLLDENGSELDAGDFTLEGINTLDGGFTDIAFTDNLSYNGPLILQVSTALINLDGNGILRPVEAQYELVSGGKLEIGSVARLNDGEPGRHYFHGDGTETALLSGSGFGEDASALSILVGDAVVDAGDIISVSDTEVRFNVPDLRLGVQTTSLRLTVTRDEVSASVDGAIVIMPRVQLQDIDPIAGPPQGGNFVDLFGRGFNKFITVKFGTNPAGDLRILSANRIQVRAPSNSFGA